jgi:NADH-quinone oxidoreductase subunit N
MNLGAFAVAMAVINEWGTEEISAFKGLAKRPGKGFWVSMAMALFMFSLTGLPPTVGFVGKFYIFAAVIDAKLYWLALIGVLNSVVSLYYYVSIVKCMFFEEPADSKPLVLNGFAFPSLLVGLAGATLFFGIFWKSLAVITQSSANLFL